MKKIARKMDHAKEKVVGEIREAAGKITGNHQLELKGKIQSSKADLKMKANDVAEGIVKKINNAFVK